MPASLKLALAYEELADMGSWARHVLQVSLRGLDCCKFVGFGVVKQDELELISNN